MLTILLLQMLQNIEKQLIKWESRQWLIMMTHPFNPLILCGFDNETLNHLFLHSPRFTNEKQNLLLKMERIISNISEKTDTIITSKLFHGNPSFSAELNTNIPNSSTDYVLTTTSWNLLLLQRLDS